MYDEVHVNVFGYDLLYPVIERWMETLGGAQPPETTAPETTIPETTATETTAPETTIPETTAPETTVPETTVPETTDGSAATGGCGATVGGTSVILLLACGAGSLCFRKKRT